MSAVAPMWAVIRVTVNRSALPETLLSVSSSIPLDPSWALDSDYFGSFGAMLPVALASPMSHCSRLRLAPRGHYQGDELSFTWWGAGAYLAVDYGSFYHPRMWQDWMHNKVTIGLGSHSPVARPLAKKSPRWPIIFLLNMM